MTLYRIIDLITKVSFTFDGQPMENLSETKARDIADIANTCMQDSLYCEIHEQKAY